MYVGHIIGSVFQSDEISTKSLLEVPGENPQIKTSRWAPRIKRTSNPHSTYKFFV